MTRIYPRGYKIKLGGTSGKEDADIERMKHKARKMRTYYSPIQKKMVSF